MAKRRPKGQHFLLSARARTLSLFEALNLSEDEAEARFAATRRLITRPVAKAQSDRFVRPGAQRRAVHGAG